jgi:hypothetical protein
MKKGHSSGNGDQTKALLRELAHVRSSIGNLQSKIDNAVALADQEVGLGIADLRLPLSDCPVSPNQQSAIDNRQSTKIQNPAGGPGFGVRDRSSYYSSSLTPAIPVPRPDPSSESRIPSPQVVGIPGTPIVGGFLQDLGEYEPNLMGRNAIPTYEQMRRGDAQVHATLAACKLPVLSAKWQVVAAEDRNAKIENRNSERVSSFEFRVSSTGEGKNTQAKAKEVAAFVRENLFGGLEFRASTGAGATQNWDDVVRNALLMLDFGCAAHEDVWTVDGSRVRLRRLAARLPLTFYRWHTDADGETLLALEQYGYRGARFLNVLLPAEKMALFTYGREGANFWGIALQRAMYPHWYAKKGLYRIDIIACERNALGIPAFKLPAGFSKQDQQAAYKFVTQLAAHEMTGIVEPPGDPSTGLRIVGYEGRVRDVMPSIQHHNTMISRAALALFMDLAQSQHGSRALGQQHGDFFLLALQNLADQVALNITNSSVRRLVAYNFGEDAPVPKLVAANVQSRDITELTDSLTKFAQAGLVVSEENLRKFIRQELALPEESATGVVAIRGEAVTSVGE